MEGFYKWLAKVANKELEKRELKRNAAGLANRMDCLSGQMAIGFDDLKLLVSNTIDKEISDYWRSNGPILVKQMTDGMAPRLSDHAVVLKEIGDENHEKVQKDLNRGFTLNASLMGRVLGNQAVAANVAEKRMNVIMQSFEEMCRQAAIHDGNNSDRSLVLVEMFRALNAKIDHNNNISQGMQVRFFENLTMQLRMATAKPKERFSAAPKLQWVFDHVEDMMKLCDALRAARSNDAPRSSMMMRAISAIRSMDLSFGHSSIRGELERLFKSWDNDQLQAA